MLGLGDGAARAKGADRDETARTLRRRRMRRGAGGAVLLATLAVGATQAAAAQTQWEVETTGSVAVPLRFPLDPTGASWPGGHRQIYNATQRQANGQVGYTVELPATVAGGLFELEVTGGATGLEDLDVTFYSDLTTPVSGGASTERGAGGETGKIPGGTTHAIVTLFDGADAKFVLRADRPRP